MSLHYCQLLSPSNQHLPSSPEPADKRGIDKSNVVLESYIETKTSVCKQCPLSFSTPTLAFGYANSHLSKLHPIVHPIPIQPIPSHHVA